MAKTPSQRVANQSVKAKTREEMRAYLRSPELRRRPVFSGRPTAAVEGSEAWEKHNEQRVALGMRPVHSREEAGRPIDTDHLLSGSQADEARRRSADAVISTPAA